MAGVQQSDHSLAHTAPLSTLPLHLSGLPPDLNHYVRHTRDGRHYKTSESKRFAESVAAMVAGRYVIGEEFTVSVIVRLPPGKKGDVDGFGKVLLDALAGAGVFRNDKLEVLSDAYVYDFHIRKYRAESAKDSYTEVLVTAIQS